MPKIKASRSVQAESVICDFQDVAETQVQVVESIPTSNVRKCVDHGESMKAETSSHEMEPPRKEMANAETLTLPSSKATAVQGAEACTPKIQISTAVKRHGVAALSSRVKGEEAHTPKTQISAVGKGLTGAAPSISKNMTAKKIANSTIKRSALKPKNLAQMVRGKREVEPSSQIGNAAENSVYNRAQKRQKLEEGKTPAQVAGFVSMAEIVKKFQSNTRELFQNKSLSRDDNSTLTLTRPKEPRLVTAGRVRSVKIKSSSEIEEEMLAKIPKFKARPMNKKILEAPSLPALPRSIPRPPEFQEFHLKTMERASQHETSSVCSTSLDVPIKKQGQQWNKLVEPKSPRLETTLRARPPTVKSSAELELEELEKMPKFKARPLNKKIFESKGDLGIFCNKKRQLTTPKEFHFATNERIPSSNTFADMFDKLSLNSESSRDQQIPRITTPNPFHLHTEERGLAKEKKLTVEVLQKQLEEERARIPKALPYPYTTDYPVFPPKPVPKECTRPEAFQLESLVRHEEEMQRKHEERERMEREEAQKRIFRAQPILIENPIPLPEKARKPLTEVQGFTLHVDHRAVDRAEFDKKMKEKEMMYKRRREEQEAAKMMEEEAAVKHMRMTMVPHARPLPKFDNPFLPQKSGKERTKPKSPHLLVDQRKERRLNTYTHLR
ncbi:Protein TPX2 [Acorus calamus]|uniref:Protein TPX2 n=1 Tax=Acorus calamus TaxID=4465 RepID=A0AAV9CIC1_ACOCL|nr:Protein TPX2 [Acorus calamus]